MQVKVVYDKSVDESTPSDKVAVISGEHPQCFRWHWWQSWRKTQVYLARFQVRLGERTCTRFCSMSGTNRNHEWYK